jgi:hypothetical protein
MSASSSTRVRKKTGETCDIAGQYEFDGYTDGTSYPPPTQEERVIPMDVDDTFPPVKSSEKAAWWKLI